MFKVNKRSTRCHSGVFVVNFEYSWQVSSIFFPEFEHVNAWQNTLLSYIILYHKALLPQSTAVSSYYLFCVIQLDPRCCIGLEVNIVTLSTKILKGIGGNPPWSIATLIKYETLTLIDAVKTHFQRFFA